MSAARLLFVDDEANVLIGINRVLHGRYDVTLANSGAEALQALEHHEFDVVVSDMRMPGMSGNELLVRVQQRQPRAVRLVLSGQSDLEAAAAAINDGRVFRFLLKPIGRDALLSALEAALAQRRLVEAERELLERTLNGAIDGLSEALALANPEAFGRSRRLRRIVSALATEAGLPRRWPLEMAASLSQLGAISLPPETARRWYAGEALDATESAMVARAASVPQQLLRHLPRIEPVIALLDALSTGGVVSSPTLSIEESTLLAAAEVERRLSSGEPLTGIIASLDADARIPRVVIDGLRKLGGLLLGARPRRAVSIVGLQPGMVLVEDVRTRAGGLLITRGHEVSDALMVRLRNFASTVGVKEPLFVSVPEDEVEAAA
jgi:CheY-like chemotaxis protein